MRIVAPVEFSDGLRIRVPGFRFYQHALLEVRLKDALQCDEEGCAVMAVPIGVPAGRNLGIVDLNFDFRIPGKGRKEDIQQDIAMEAVARLRITVKAEFEFPIIALGTHIWFPFTALAASPKQNTIQRASDSSSERRSLTHYSDPV